MTLFYHNDFISSHLMLTFRLARFGALHLRPPFPTPNSNLNLSIFYCLIQ